MATVLNKGIPEQPVDGHYTTPRDTPNVAIKEYADLTGFDGGTAFTVSGVVKLQVIGIVGAVGIESTSGTTNLQLGTAGAPDELLFAALDGSNLVADTVWLAGASAPAADVDWFEPDTEWAIVNNGDLVFAPDTNDITQGSLTLYVVWEPISPGATVTPA